MTTQTIDFSKINAKGLELFENESDFKVWLNSPILALGGKKPIELINYPAGREEILNVLLRMEHGILS